MTRVLSLVLVSAIVSVAHADTKPAKTDPYATRNPTKPPPKGPSGSGYSGLGAESVSPEIVAQFAPQPLDERVSRKIQSMLDVRGAGGGLLTSKGDRMVFGSRVTGTSQVWRQDGAMKFAVQ